MSIKVMIADDHPMIAQGIRLIFFNYPDIELCGIYRNGAELIRGLAESLPDVLILDIQLPDSPGDELLPGILEMYPGLNVLVLTNFDSTMYANKMLWQGAKGFLLKTADEETLVQAVRVLAKGDRFIEPELADKLEQDNLRSRRMFTAKTTLTLREKEILQLIVEGFTDQEIAEKLFLGWETVKHYRKGLLLKLDVKNTAALVSRALKLGLAK